MPFFEEEFFREPPSPGDDANDPSRLERQRERAALREIQKDEYLARALDDPIGRAWLWDLLVGCHIFESRFIPGQADSTAFCLGERNIGLQVLAQVMRVAPAAYPLMASENADG